MQITGMAFLLKKEKRQPVGGAVIYKNQLPITNEAHRGSEWVKKDRR